MVPAWSLIWEKDLYISLLQDFICYKTARNCSILYWFAFIILHADWNNENAVYSYSLKFFNENRSELTESVAEELGASTIVQRAYGSGDSSARLARCYSEHKIEDQGLVVLLVYRIGSGRSDGIVPENQRKQSRSAHQAYSTELKGI